MKYNAYRILITVIISVIIGAFLTGCASNQHSKTQTVQTSAQKTTKTEEAAQTEQETFTEYTAAFRAVIDNTLKESKSEHPDEVDYGRYGLYDFDNDSVPELFLEVYGSAMSDYYIHVYDFDGEKTVFIGEIRSAHSRVCGTNRENALLIESAWMGVSQWNICEFKNGEFVFSELASYYPDGFGDSIEPENNPLHDMGYEIKDIEFYKLDDLTGIEKR